MFKRNFAFHKLILCLILIITLVIGTVAVSGADDESYIFDFEEASSGKYNNSSAWSYDNSAGGFAGNKTSVLKFDPPSRNTFIAPFIMPEAADKKYALDYDSKYEVSFKYYSEGIGSGVIDNFMIRDNSTVLADVELEIDKKSGTSGEWKTATVTFEPQGDNTYLYFGLKVSGQYSKVCIYFDDFTVKATKAERGTPDETFINTADGVINFDGENAEISSTGLKYISGERRFVCGNSTTMLKFTSVSNTTVYRVLFYNGLSTVPLNNDKLYTIKFKYYNPSATGKTTLTMGLCSENSAWTDYNIGDSVILDNSTVGWVDGSISFMAIPKTEDANHLFIQVGSDAMGAEVYFDNFTVTQEADMDIDIIEMDLEDKNAKLTSAAWSWVDAKEYSVAGNASTLLKFSPGEKALTYYVTKLYKGKRTIPIDDGASYSLSFDYYCDAYSGTIGEFYIKNKSGKNLFMSDLEVSPTNGTNGNWKRANFVFSGIAEADDYLQIMCYTKADNTNVQLFFDNFKLVRLDNILVNQNILEAEKESFKVTVTGRNTDFDGYADLSLQYKLNFSSTYGNKKVIDIGGDKYLVSDYGILYRPNQFNALGTLCYDDNAISEELISIGYNTEIIGSGSSHISFKSDIINLRTLYKSMDIDARPYIVITPMNGTGTVYSYGSVLTLNVAETAANSQDEIVRQFIS